MSSEETAGDAQPIVVAFYKRYYQDLRGGGVEPLEVYQAAFSGYEEVIAREYERIAHGEASDASPDGVETDADTAVVGPEDLAAGGAGPDHPDGVEGYRLLEVLGQGGMGTVYKAFQKVPIRRLVALKVIKLGMDTREVVARFETERQALALLEHPSIARVYDAGATRSGRPFFAMELVEGTPITEFCDRRQMDVARRLQLFARVCEAIQHAHQKGIVHRDIKPSNILVADGSDGPVPKVIDFGVSKSTKCSLTLRSVYTEVGQLVGTPAYMSPEQADLGGIHVDTRTDIYSLGVVLYEILTAEMPFGVDEMREVGLAEALRRLAEVVPPRPSTRLRRAEKRLEKAATDRGTESGRLVRALKNDLDWVVMKALEKDPNRRYASAAEMAAEVERHLEHRPLLAGPPSVTYRLRKFGRRYRTALTLASAVVVLLVASVFGAQHLEKRSADRQQTARSEGFIEDGLAAHADYTQETRRARELEAAWTARRESGEGWEPVWILQDEIQLWETWNAAASNAAQHYNQTVLSFGNAMEAARPGSREFTQARDLLSDLYWQRFEDIYWSGEETLGPEYAAALLEVLGKPSDLERLELRGRLELASDPPGARIYCFRYERVEGRLFPVAFDPHPAGDGRAAGIVGGPFLTVERLWAKGSGRESESESASFPFRTGDRFVELGGQEIRLLSDLVAAVNALGPGETTAGKILRAGEEVAFTWLPFPTHGDGGTEKNGAPGLENAPPIFVPDDIRTRLGFTLAAYPLDFARTPVAGVTREDGPVKIELPRGSYLFVVRNEGYVDARLPVSVPLPPELADGKISVRLLSTAEAPPGFVHVPAGWVALGGDRDADASLPAGRHFVPGFLMSRLEVTFGEYLEFLNALQDAGQLDDPDARAKLVPTFKGTLEILSRDAQTGHWGLAERLDTVTADTPVFGVPILAALEYVEWLSEKHGGRWRFRLPTDLEWEKAARGADRRFYVWGNYPLYSFCRSGKARDPRFPNRPAVVDAFPFDESVYGVRGMAGSASEPTADVKEGRFVSTRGSSWWATTDYYTRVTNRNGRLPEEAHNGQGIRLVADLPPR